MAINILAWNMQGERNTGYSDVYPLIFGQVLPRLVKQAPADTWIVYLCECGNPFGLNAKAVKPGAIGYFFESKDSGQNYYITPWSMPKGIAVRGIYCPWQSTDTGKNLRCSTMIMEVATYSPLTGNQTPSFNMDYQFIGSDDANLDNIRPVAYVTKYNQNSAQYYVGGVHNVAAQSPAVKAVNRLVQFFFAGTLGSMLTGDMNVAAPIPPNGTWPNTINLGNYSALLAGGPTQLSGNQLDWAMYSFGNPKTKGAGFAKYLLGVSPFDTGKYSGYISSDHEIMVYSIGL